MNCKLMPNYLLFVILFLTSGSEIFSNDKKDDLNLSFSAYVDTYYASDNSVAIESEDGDLLRDLSPVNGKKDQFRLMKLFLTL